MAEINVSMADRTHGSLMACAGNISSCVMPSEGILIGRSLLDFPSVVGPLLMPRDIGDRKCLLTQKCFRPGLCVLVLVPTLLPFCCSEALDQGSKEPEEAVDSEDADKEVAVVVAVVFVDSGPLKRRCSLSSGQVHPRVSAS